jgi:hypothetical protein
MGTRRQRALRAGSATDDEIDRQPFAGPEAPRDAAIALADRSGSAHASNDQPQDGRVILIVLDHLPVTDSTHSP